MGFVVEKVAAELVLSQQCGIP